MVLALLPLLLLVAAALLPHSNSSQHLQCLQEQMTATAASQMELNAAASRAMVLAVRFIGP
jgi:hypothetical protein